MRDFDLTLAAEDDLTGIWLHTHETWGLDQADKYFDLIVACCEAVGRGTALSKPVGGLTGSIRVHRCEQHYIFSSALPARLFLRSCMDGWIFWSV